jgi:hypothetical protein
VAYAPAYAPMRRRLDLALRALRALKDDPAAGAAAVQERVLAGGGPRYSINALDGEAAFLGARLEAMHLVRGTGGGEGVGPGERVSGGGAGASRAAQQQRQRQRRRGGSSGAAAHGSLAAPPAPQAGVFAKPGEGPGPLPPFVGALKAAAQHIVRAQMAAEATPVPVAPPPKPSKKRKAADEDEEGEAAGAEGGARAGLPGRPQGPGARAASPLPPAFTPSRAAIPAPRRSACRPARRRGPSVGAAQHGATAGRGGPHHAAALRGVAHAGEPARRHLGHPHLRGLLGTGCLPYARPQPRSRPVLDPLTPPTPLPPPRRPPPAPARAQPRINAALPSSAIHLPEDDVDDELEARCLPDLEVRGAELWALVCA